MIQRIRRRYLLVGAILIVVVLLAGCVFSLLFTRGQLVDASVTNLRSTAEFHITFREDRGMLPSWTPAFAEGTVTVVLYNDLTIDEIIRSNSGPFFDRETIQCIVQDCTTASTSSGVLHQHDVAYYLTASARNPILILGAWGEQENTLWSVTGSLASMALLLALVLFLVLWLSSRWLARFILAYSHKQDTFIAAASHELKTPLAVVKANLGVLKAHPEKTVGEQDKWLGYIQEETDRMNELVGNLLEVSRLKYSRVEEVLSPVDLSDMVQGETLMFEPMAFERKRSLQAEVQDGLFVTGSDTRLRRLIVILMDNACKYSREGSCVTVRLTGTEHTVTLSVHNVGTPIPPEALKSIFNPFYTVNESRARSYGGYGLGLAIAQGVVEQHRGKIAVESSEEDGTTFTVTLPRAHP